MIFQVAGGICRLVHTFSAGSFFSDMPASIPVSYTHLNKVTIVFTDNQAQDKYTVSAVKLIPSSWREKEYPATSVEVTVKKGVATVTLTFLMSRNSQIPK